MTDPAGSPPDLVLFDGTCHLCHGAVRFVARRDPAGRFAFLPMQTDTGRAVCARLGVNPDDPDSFALIRAGAVLSHSNAWLAILRALGPGWRLLAGLALCVPRPLRDASYRFVARRRYRWFGRSAQCRLPGAGARLADESTVKAVLRSVDVPER